MKAPSLVRLPHNRETTWLNRWVLVVLVGLTVGLFVLRLSFLDTHPPGFFVDESSIALNALFVSRAGTDEFGARLPLYFRAFGDYKNPLFIYSVAIVFTVWPGELNVGLVRAVAAAWVIIAVVLFAVFMRQSLISSKKPVVTWDNQLLWWLGVLVVLVYPWWLGLGRVAFEVASLPVFLVAAMVLGQELWSSQRVRVSFPTHLNRAVDWEQLLRVCGLSLLLGLVLGLLFYSYTAARLLSPLLAAAAMAATGWTRGWRGALLVGLGWLVCFVPLFWSASVRDGALSARYEVVGLSNYTADIFTWAITVFQQYIRHFEPSFLWMGGDQNLRHVMSPYGLVSLGMLPLIGYGMYFTLIQERSVLSWWSWWGLLLSPIPSALTVQSPHVLRSVGMSVYLLYFCWQGMRALHRGKIRWRKWLLGICLMAIMVEAIGLGWFGWIRYPQAARPWFDAGVVEAIEIAAVQPGKMAISPQLYPGTYATAAWFSFVGNKTPLRRPDQNQSWSAIFTDATTAATLVVPATQCTISTNGQIVFRNQDACVLVWKPAPSETTVFTQPIPF